MLVEKLLPPIPLYVTRPLVVWDPSLHIHPNSKMEIETGINDNDNNKGKVVWCGTMYEHLPQLFWILNHLVCEPNLQPHVHLEILI